MLTPLLALGLVLAAFLIASAVLVVIGMIDSRRASRLRDMSSSERGLITFLFDDEALLDASPAARDLLASGPRHGSDWARLAAMLEPRFPRLNDWIADLAELGQMERTSKDGTSQLNAEWHDGVARIVIASTGTIDTSAMPDQHALTALSSELETLRLATDSIPHPIWKEDENGRLLWCNNAYMDLADDLDGEQGAQSWPPARLFDLPLSDDTRETQQRMALSADDDETRHWFEVDRRPGEGSQICVATPADTLVKAENSLSEFMTTLTKTFATLPIGLAIFNRDRELAMFNPALLDLTSLPVDFLIAKPNLGSFLDRLREGQMMPEPKDYKSWKQRVADLVTQARNGTYEEIWALPAGQTYRVTGRPHPDGAVAFLFEDISTEMSHARRYRAEIETSQAALDAMPSAVAVFSSAGVLTLTNRSYADLWGYDPSTSIGEVSIYDAIKKWQSDAAPSGVWEEIRAFVSHTGSRKSWDAHIALSDGRNITCRVLPMPNGATMVDFTPLSHIEEARTGNDSTASEKMRVGLS